MVSFDRFTDRAKKAMNLARQEALRLNHAYLGTEHMLLGIVQEGNGVAANVLRNLEVDLAKVRVEVEKRVKAGDVAVDLTQLPFTPRAKTVLELAMKEAGNLGHNYIGTEHLTLGLIAEGDGIAAQALAVFGLKLERVRAGVLEFLGAEPDDDVEEEEIPPPRVKTPALDAFGTDLTERARAGRLRPFFGRDSEMQRLLQILCRRRQGTPLLVGPHGVGKTAILEGLATAIAEDRVPRQLRDCPLVQLNLDRVVERATHRGQVEERFKAVLKEARRLGKVVFYIDKLPALVRRTGASVPIFDLLRPALALGECRCVVTASPAEHEALVARDGAAASEFQPIWIHATPPEVTREILRVLKPELERHYDLHVLDEALDAAVALSEAFLEHTHAPANAIDLLDDTSARVALSRTNPSTREKRKLAQALEGARESVRNAVDEKDWERAKTHRDAAKELEARLAAIEEEARLPGKREVAVDVERITETVSEQTGESKETLRAHLRGGGAGAGLDVDLGDALPAFERLQIESVLHGSAVRIEPGTGFVLMPLRDEFRAVFEDAIRPALDANGVRAVKAEDIYEPGAILTQVWRSLLTAEVIVADVSTGNANVVYELGLCHALGRSPILLSRAGEALPPALSRMRVQRYENTLGGTLELREQLSRTVAEHLRRIREDDPVAATSIP